jgi:hypothetical protein
MTDVPGGRLDRGYSGGPRRVRSWRAGALLLVVTAQQLDACTRTSRTPRLTRSFLGSDGGLDTGAELDPESSSREGGQNVGSEATGEAEYTPLLWDADRLEVVPQSAIRKRVVWSGDADFENTFEAALPGGNIVLAASTGGWVRIYTSSQGLDSAQYWSIPSKGRMECCGIRSSSCFGPWGTRPGAHLRGGRTALGDHQHEGVSV